MKTHGDRGWKSLPSYLDVVVPRVLEFLEGRSLKITFFLVGQDAVQDENAGLLAAIAQAGHEIGNHSYHHEPWLASSPVAEIEAEIARAEEAIRAATGRTPVGFRGPGYSTSATLIGVLARRGYLYDASTIPTFVGPRGSAPRRRGAGGTCSAPGATVCGPFAPTSWNGTAGALSRSL